MKKDQLLELAEILEYEGNPSNSEKLLSALPNWDSVAILGVISFADSIGNSSLTPESFLEAKTVGDIAKLVFPEGAEN